MHPLLFADDASFISSHKNLETLISYINEQLIRVGDWCTTNKFTIHVDKTVMMKVTNKKSENNIDIVQMSGCEVNFSEDCTFLGVKIDNNLNFANHISYIKNKIAKSTGILYKIQKLLSHDAKLNYYFSFVYPYLSYNIIIWGGTSPTHLQPLIIQQKKIIRIISGASYLAHTRPLFHKLKLLKLTDIHKFLVAVYMFNEQSNETFSVPHSINTRYRNNLTPKFHRLSRCQQAISYIGPSIWNQIPLIIRQISDLKLFKRTLKSYYIDQYCT